jgi:hypothetical protein
VSVSNGARRILAAMMSEPSGKIDAQEFADEIVELLKAGLVSLGGTLQATTLELTQTGRDFVASQVNK